MTQGILTGLALTATLAVTLPQSAHAAAQQAWPQSHFDPGHSGYNPQEKTLTATNISGLKQKWGLVGNYQIYAAALDGGIVFVQGYNGDTGMSELRALNAQSGKVKWTVSMSVNGPQPAIAAAQGLVFTECTAADTGGTQVGGICAYKQSNGQAVWQYVVPCNCIPESGLDTSLAYDNGAVIFGYGYGTGTGYANYILALDAKKGKVMWSSATGGNNSIATATPAVNGGKVYVGCSIPDVGLSVCALSETDGSLLWYGGAASDIRNISADDQGVYALECGSVSLIKLKPGNGKPVWSFGTGGCGGGTNQFPVAMAGNYVYYSSDRLYALRAKDGKQAWSVPSPASSAAIADGIVLIEGGLDSSGNVPSASAYDASKGTLLWSSAEGGVYWNWAPMIVNGTVYYGADGSCGSICAYQRKGK